MGRTASAFFRLSPAALFVALAVSCSGDCERDRMGFCKWECSSDSDCNSCLSVDGCCQQTHECRAGLCEEIPQGPDTCAVEPVFPPPGWNDGFGSGHVFILKGIQLAPFQPGNQMGLLANSWNDTFSSAVWGGGMLWAIQISGVDSLSRNGAVTVSMAPVRDADPLVFPANNFSAPEGYNGCCQFFVERYAVSQGVALARWPAILRDGRLESYGQGTFLGTYQSYEGTRGEWLIEHATLLFHSVGQDHLLGRITGGHPVAWLGRQPVGFWGFQRPREADQLGLLDVIYGFVGQPDFDIDGDGLECLLDVNGDAAIDMCCDGNSPSGCGSGCTELPPVDQGAFVPCAGAAGFADAYSVSYQLEAVPASIVGIAN